MIKAMLLKSIKYPLISLAPLLVCLITINSTQAFPGIKATPKIPAEHKPAEPTLIQLFVRVNVGRTANSRDYFALSPYPVAPLKVKWINNIVSTNEDDLKKMIEDMVDFQYGKLNGLTPDWRIRKAFEQAMRSSRKHLPAQNEAVDIWANGMLPYFRTEILAMNTDEKNRQLRYKAIEKLAKEYQTEQENGAPEPAQIPLKLYVSQTTQGIREGMMRMPAGEWWIIGKHIVPGLVYYWQQPIKISEADPARYVQLTEANVLVMQGDLSLLHKADHEKD